MYKEVLKILQDKQVDLKYVTLREFGVICIQKRGVNENFKQEKKYFVDGIVSKDESKVKRQKFESAMDVIDGKQIMVDIPYGLLPGDTFGQYKDIYQVKQEGEQLGVLTHQTDQILIVHIWSSWCGSGQKYLKDSLGLLQTHQKKIRVVAINADDDLSVFNKWFTEKPNEENGNLEDKRKGYRESFQHFRIKGWDIDHPFLTDFGVSSLPFICVVDKFRKIHYSGHPKEIDIVHSVDRLLAQQNEEGVIDPYENFRKKNLQKLSPLLTRQKFQQNFKQSEYLCIKANQNNSFDKKAGDNLQRVNINVYYYKEDVKTKQKLNIVFENFTNFQNPKIEQIDCVLVPVLKPQNSKCWNPKCKVEFKKPPYYWLRSQEQQLFGCRKCVESSPSQNKFDYTKTSILLTGNCNMISKKLLGEKQSNLTLFTKCIKCDDEKTVPRYVCLGCRVDPCYQREKNRVILCNKCFIAYTEKRERDVRNALQKQSHKDNHPFLRIFN